MKKYISKTQFTKCIESDLENRKHVYCSGNEATSC